MMNRPSSRGFKRAGIWSLFLLVFIAFLYLLLWLVSPNPDDKHDIGVSRHPGFRDDVVTVQPEVHPELTMHDPPVGDVPVPGDVSIEEEAERESLKGRNVDQGYSIEGRAYVFGSPMESISIRAHFKSGLDSAENTITWPTASAETDPGGSFRIDGLILGRYTLYASYRCEAGRFSAQKEVELRRNQVQCDIRIAEVSLASLSGELLRYDDPVPGVRVTLRGKLFSAMETTDNTGRFLFPKIPPGWHELEIMERDRDRRIQKDYLFKAGEIVKDRLQLETGTGVLFGDVSVDGMPFAMGVVEIDKTPPPGGAALRILSGIRNGSYYEAELPDGAYTVTYRSPWTKRMPVDVSGAAQTRLDIAYTTGKCEIKGTVYGRTFVPRSKDAAVFLFDRAQAPWAVGDDFLLPTTAEGLVAEDNVKIRNGNFSFSKLPVGDYLLVCVKETDGKVESMAENRASLMEGDKVKVDLIFTD